MNDERDKSRNDRGLRSSVKGGPVALWAIRAVRATRFVLRRVLEAILAVVIVFEEWGWRPLSAALAALARYPLMARLEAGVAALPPYPSLLVFVTPSILILPLKLVSLWLIAGGHLLWASALFIGAKVVGTALVARIFQLTQPKLMQLAWFVYVHDKVMPWKDALVERVRSSWVWRTSRTVKERIRTRMAPVVAAIRPIISVVAARVRSTFATRGGN